MSYTILIVEDNRNSIYLLEQLLRDAGHTVWPAVNGEEAVDLIKSRGLPDLVVSDALMPRMDGFELCHILRSDPTTCTVPFVIYTATFTDESDEHFAHDVGADCYLIKPFDPERVVARFEEVIRDVRAKPPRPVRPKGPGAAFFEGHSRRMSMKLETKVDELSATNAALAASESEIRQLNDRLVASIRNLEAEIEERHRTNNQLTLAFQVAHMGSFAFDFDRGISTWSREALDLLDQPPGQRSFNWDLFARRVPPKQRAAAALVFSPDAHDTESHQVEFALECGDGTIRHIIARSQRVAVDEFGENRRIGVLRDISIRRRAEIERAQMERSLRQAQKMEAIGNLAGGIAHDFNNFLAVISASGELLEMDAAENGLPEHWRDGMRDIRQACARAKDLVAQILLFSRNEPSKREPIDLRNVIRDAIGQFNNTVRTNIVVATDLRTKRLAVANIGQINQILLNLCNNAKYAIGNRPGEITIRLSEASFTPAQAQRRPPLNPGDYLLLEVADTGSGMDEDTLQRIFEPFFSTKPPGEGTGLGLAMVHGIVVGHDGAIFADSTPGQGTCISIYIPAARDALAPSAADRGASPLPTGKGERILVVDDEPAVAKVACSLINRLGYRAESMNDARTARDRLLHNPDEFALVVTDYFMPGLTGVDLGKAVWTKYPDLPIIMIVGFGGQMDAGRARAEGFKAFVSKPFTLQSLSDAISLALQPE
ncbi:response regulator [Actomonas aquatica]|uniref:histidine kinase n=1 Tax=Actomonas aquatica TaxID=2866162 RepID=A0ABZ1C776_9BACT|nr:response regulator [Opitutus sp. WL0086]WRQ87113.1 response regulator [Opitutus sp. WL0086]